MKIYPAEAFYGGTGVFLKYLIVGLLVSVLLGRLDVSSAEAPGFLEGRLKIVSPKEVKLAHESSAKKEGKNYADYPLVVSSRDRGKEIARVTADRNGNYRVALPPGAYVLDVQDRPRKHVRARPQLFRISSDQTVHVDMALDTGIR